MLDLIKEIDTSVFLFLNGSDSDFWDRFMWFVSEKFTLVPLYAFFLFIIFRQYRVRAFYMMVGIFLVVLVADQSSVHLFKNVFERLRPCHEPSLEGLVHLVNDRCGGRYGFVSSHAANVFGVASFLFLILKTRWVAYIAVGWAIIVSYSRIYLGVHYPLDVVFGALLGIFIGWLIYQLSRFLSEKSIPKIYT